MSRDFNPEDLERASREAAARIRQLHSEMLNRVFASMFAHDTSDPRRKAKQAGPSNHNFDPFQVDPDHYFDVATLTKQWRPRPGEIILAADGSQVIAPAVCEEADLIRHQASLIGEEKIREFRDENRLATRLGLARNITPTKNE